jgi:hypothetical protein
VLKLLLDEHISPNVAKGLRARRVDLTVYAQPEWHNGRFLGEPDGVCIENARMEGLTFVTFDLKTIPQMLKEWETQGKSHAGVILVNRQRISTSDIGGLIRSLIALVDRSSGEEWTDRVEFLR